MGAILEAGGCDFGSVVKTTVLLADIQELGLASGERELYERWITSPNGLVLVCGPTGESVSA